MNKNYFYNLIISLANILFPVLSFPYASHVLGPIGIGKVQFVISFAQYFGLIAALGIPVYGIAAIARTKSNNFKLSKTFSELLVLHLSASVLFSVIYFTIIFWHPYFEPDLALYLIAGLLLLLGFTSIDWLYSGIEKFRLIALRSVLVKSLSVIFLFVFVKSADDYLNYLAILIFSLLGNNLISLLYVNKHTSFLPRSLHLKKHFKPVLLILGTTVATNMYAIWDTVLLGFLSGIKSVGIYTAAIKLVKISIPFIISMGAGLIPSITENYKLKNEGQLKLQHEKSFHFIVLLSVPIVAGILLLAPEFIEVFSGSGFMPAVSTMRIISFLPLIIGLGHFFSWQVLIPAGMNNQMLYSSAIGACLSLLMNFALVPSFGAIGAGIANISTELLVTTLFYMYIKKQYNLPLNWRLLLNALICCVLFLPTVYLVKTNMESSLMILIISVVSCSAEYFLLQYLIYKDVLVINTYKSFKMRLANLPKEKYHG